jgi:type II secretory pathway pseudopilin PulG
MPNSAEENIWLDWEQLVVARMQTSLRRGNRWPRALAARRNRSEAGELLIETLMTVAIIGISFVAVFSAVFTSIRIADYASKISKADAVVRAYAEAMKAPDGASAYVPCTVAGGTVSYPAAMNPWTPPAQYSQYSATIKQIRYLTGYAAGVPTWSATCPATDLGSQEITLSATGPINDPAVRGTETVVITKRDARGDL